MQREKMEISVPKTIITILIAPIELALSPILMTIPNKMVQAISLLLLFFIGFLVAIILYKDVLKRDWHLFKQHVWKNLLTSIIGLAILPVIITVTRSLLAGLTHATNASAGGDATTDSVYAALITVILSITALLAPFTEEIMARHVLFYQFKGRGIITLIMFFVSSIFFGLIHWNNFHGDIMQMIPYMFAGAWFAAIYYFSKNIWVNIITHFLFDCLTPIAAIFMLIVAIIQH